jgi:hypothetical protein
MTGVEYKFKLLQWWTTEVEARIEWINNRHIPLSHATSFIDNHYPQPGHKMSGDLPAGLSPSYWRSWNPRTGLSVNESLENGEEWIGQWDGVGLYEQYVISLPPLILDSWPSN